MSGPPVLPAEDEVAPVDGPESLPAGAAGPPAVSAPWQGQRAIRALVTRWFFGIAAAVAGAGALLAALALPDGLARDLLVGGHLVYAALAAAALRWVRERTEDTMLLLAAAAAALVGATALATGHGLGAAGLGFLALLVCLVGALASRARGVAVAAVAVAALVAVALRDAADAMAVLASALAPQLLVVAAGLAGGWLLSNVLARYARLAAERERRFVGLLSIAADAYWELDARYRLVSVTLPREDGLALDAGIGSVPWELPAFACDAETLDQLQADLDARQPFRDHPVTWQDGAQAARQLLVSGEPRFDERGVFVGYWGVARDVTADHQARAVLAATENSYHDLFARIPTPLVLHRRGRIADANPAALALFGHRLLEELVGTDLPSLFESGDSRERARQRIEQLETMPLGEALPVSEYRLVSRTGRRIVARATGVRVLHDGEAATLSIFADDTDRKAAEDAVRRSETMLSNLVASSPDAIVLCEFESDRFAMVNQAFERTLGWTAADVAGRSTSEIGVWRREQDREQLRAALRTNDRVVDVPTEFVARDGQIVPMLVSAARFTLDRRDYLVINARDISVAERARLEREAILENTSIGVAVTRERVFVMANPAFEQMYGWPRGGLLGQPGRVVWTSDADYEEVGRIAGPALARGEAVELDRPARRRDGSTFLARIVGKAIDPSHPAKGGTIWIVEDVTELRQTAEALARALDQAEAASRAKSAFLANTSHELRTPLNGMLGLAQLARAPDVDEARRRQYLDQIVDSAQSLAEILSDILDLAKIEAGKMTIEQRSFDLEEQLRALHRGYATLAQARELAFELEIGDDLAGCVSGDPVRVRQVLSNYVTNALKFTSRGGVRLAARRIDGGERVRFEVHDTGPGIEPDVQRRLFRPFTQADESTTRRFGGTGLGLSICRELAHLMGGEVGVVSRPGEGSVFWAELPLPPVAADPPAPAAADRALPRLGPARVLLAEDNPVNMLIGVAILERWGLEVAQATDGREALAAVHEAARAGRPFDAVLMDLQMPVMSGVEAVRALRADFPPEVLPVIALTAAALVSEREQALEAGMTDFLTKPIDAERLRATLARVLAARAAVAP